MRRIAAAIRAIAARARFEREMREELRLHIQHRADDLASAGMRRDEAERRARLEFGGVEKYKEQCRDASGLAPLRIFHGAGRDLRVGARRLMATPSFSLFAVLSLALGVGVTTAVYSVVNRIFWQEVQVADPDGAFFIMAPENAVNDPRRTMSAPDFDDLRAAQASFRALAASREIFPGIATDTATEIQPGEAVDGSYFGLLGVNAAIGRTIGAADETSTAAVVVLSDTLWRQRFRADPTVVGRVVSIGNRSFEIVGVALPGFEGAVPVRQRAPRFWVPLSTANWFGFGPPNAVPERERRRLAVVGRLHPGRSREEASSELRTIAAALDAAHPLAAVKGQPPGRNWRLRSITDIAEHDPFPRRVGLVLFGLITLVLVVASTNLANLVLARGTLRQSEFAVRLALGASRWRLVREQLAETLLLAVAGGLASWFVIEALIRVLDVEVPIGPGRFLSVQPEINLTVLALAALALLLALVVFGLEPAVQLTRASDVRGELAEGAGSVGVPKGRRQRMLLRWQVAISTGFFIIAALCVRYLAVEARHDSGVDLDRLSIVAADFYVQRWDDERARRAVQQIVDETAQMPGVGAAAASSGMPFGTPIMPSLSMATPDKPLTSESESAQLLIVTRDFFRTTGIAIAHGRVFDDRDAAGAQPAVILSETTARRVFGSASVVGRELLVRVDTRSVGIGVEQPVRTAVVVGVAEDTDTGRFFSRGGDTAYMPMAQEFFPFVRLVTRAHDPAVGLAATRAAARRVAPALALHPGGSGRAVMAGPFIFLRGAGIIAVALGAVTLLLAMVGLYGVQSHIVAHRTREIGVRMSFGASARQIKRMVLADGYRPVVQGLAIGILIGIAGRAIVRAFVVEKVDVVDPWMLFAVPVPLLLAAFCACYLPAHRASRVDPNVALRRL